MAKKKNERNLDLAQAIVDAYQPKTAQNIADALKDLMGGMFEAAVRGEMNEHLGYDSNEKGSKSTSNRRNGHSEKTLKSSMGEFPI